MNINSQKKANVEINQSEHFLTLQWADGFSCSYHYMWLFDNCSSQKDPVSGQREKIPIFSLHIKPELVTVNQAQQLEILWNGDNQRSQFDLDWLRQYNDSNRDEKNQHRQPVLWDGTFDITNCEAEYEDIMTKEDQLLNWLTAYKNYGVARVRNVPSQTGVVDELIDKLSYRWNFCHGTFFEVNGTIDKEHFACQI